MKKEEVVVKVICILSETHVHTRVGVRACASVCVWVLAYRKNSYNFFLSLIMFYKLSLFFFNSKAKTKEGGKYKIGQWTQLSHKFFLSEEVTWQQ